jgi:hypothetical protein
MLTLLGIAFLPVLAGAQAETPALAAGSDLGAMLPMTLLDQHGEEHTLEASPALMLLTFEKETGALVNGYLAKQGGDFL